MTFEINTLADLKNPAKWIKDNYPDGGLFFLRGTLGSGKTSFVKAFAKEHGYINTSSPTFSLLNVYGDNIYHYDLYQLEQKQIAIGEIAQNFFESGWHFVEWADENTYKIATLYGLKPIWNDFCITGEKRQIKIG